MLHMQCSLLQTIQQQTIPTASNEPTSRTINVRLRLRVFQQLEALANATVRTKSSGGGHGAKAALSPRKPSQSLVELRHIKVRPEHLGEIELGVRHLPEQEVADA